MCDDADVRAQASKGVFDYDVIWLTREAVGDLSEIFELSLQVCEPDINRLDSLLLLPFSLSVSLLAW